ncbi:hypothetical protein BG53_14085 [Paenibacillus darwinianus]|uniref:Uncharacterized protein n=2 Tax=Paenibacillus darwinianus TaxID=1380763 RepID=A0A9W5W881_9BACL|nr:hypothetical protein [Paenibacillus darwinianus]EXX87691.1 hypothetical protein CH50_04890 [Paenibacillus darwinianus]EXX89298.1 hypothetical protein BG52_15715 [Paenibacillus darwinianus]EXX90113.1 hypothetical protein BG53_14085 [Paenibacillus darwinianus]
MYKLFVEYRIEPEHRKSFLTWAEKAKKRETGLIIYEGTDQPGLFVEIWEAAGESEAERKKEERCAERSFGSEMFDYVPGGRDKVHAWTFRAV